MSLQVTPELLSAYLDQELPEREARELEAYLAHNPDVRERLAGLRRVVEDLHLLEPTQAPPALSGRVARAVALEREREGLYSRLERSMSVLGRQSMTFLMFALVLTLAVIVYLFSQALERHERAKTQVIFTDPGSIRVEGGERLEAGGRVFRKREGFWLEEGRPEDVEGRLVLGGSEEGAALRAARPGLEELWRRADVFVLELDGELVRLDTRAPPASGPAP